MGVQVIGSGGQQVTAVGVPTKRVNAAAVRIVGAGAGGAGGDHNDTTNRDAADAHPISAITGLQDALDAVAGGGSNLRVDAAIVDDTDSIDLGAAAPGNIPAVLVWGRATGNGVYEASVADGWTLLDPQPTLVVADALLQAPSFDPVLDTGVASIYDYSDTAGWQPVGAVPTLDGNPSQVWGPTGWVTAGGGALADLTDVDTSTDPPDADDVLAWDGVMWTPATLAALGGGGAPLSNATPYTLGTAAPGTSTEASRADHVHAMPSAGDVGAASSSRLITAGTGLTGGGDLSADRTVAVDFGSGAGKVAQGNDSRLSDARTPTAHVHSGADITSGTVAAARLGSDTADASTFLRGDGVWSPAPFADLNPVWPNTADGAFCWAGLGNKGTAAATVVTAVGITLCRAATISAISIRSDVGGDASSRIGLAIYAAESNGRPGALVYNAGSVATSTAGIKTLTLGTAQSLSAGLWFFATTLNAGTTPILWGQTSTTSGGTLGNRGAMGDSNRRNGNYYFTTTGGAFSSSPTWSVSMGPGGVTADIGLTFGSVP